MRLSALGPLQTDRLALLVEKRFLAGATLEHAWSVADLGVDEPSDSARFVYWDDIGVEGAWERCEVGGFLSASVRCIGALA